MPFKMKSIASDKAPLIATLIHGNSYIAFSGIAPQATINGNPGSRISMD